MPQTVTNNSIQQINSALFSLKDEVAKNKSLSKTEINNVTKEVSKTVVQINADISGCATKTELNEEVAARKEADESLIPVTEKGEANGVATLDESGRLPYSQLPESAMEFKGTWNASTNTPALTQGEGTNGDFYIVSVAGTWNGISFEVNDRIIFDGNTDLWIKLLAGAVTSVNGMSGAVTLDIPTNTSDLTNDSNFVSDASYVHTDNNFTTTLKDKLDSLSPGGVTSVNGLTGAVTLTIPSKTSELTNDSNFVSDSSYVHTDNNFTTALKTKLSSGVVTSVNGSTGAVTLDIPENTSDLTNDSGFIDDDELSAALAKKQDTLVSGTNIKTINSTSLLGSGNITISGSGNSFVMNTTSVEVSSSKAAATAVQIDLYSKGILPTSSDKYIVIGTLAVRTSNTKGTATILPTIKTDLMTRDFWLADSTYSSKVGALSSSITSYGNEPLIVFVATRYLTLTLLSSSTSYTAYAKFTPIAYCKM